MYTSLRTVTAPLKEPVSLEQAKAHLRVDNPDDDDLIRQLVLACRQTVEGWTGRAFVTQQLLWTFSQDPPTGALPLLPMPLLVLPVILSAPQVMNKPLELPRSPVISIDAVSETDTDGTVNTLTSADYIPDLAVDPARVRLNWVTMPRFLQHIQFTFTCGYGTDPASTPPAAVAAIKLLLGYLYENRGDSPDMPDRPPKAIDWLLAPISVRYFGG